MKEEVIMMSEKIYTLKKEVTKRKSLTKLKLDLTKSTGKSIDKIGNYFGKELVSLELDILDPSDYLMFNNFKVKVERATEYTETKMNRGFSKENTINLAYKFTVTDVNEDSIEFYSIPGITIKSTTRGYVYRSMIEKSGERIKVVDTKFAYGLIKAMDASIDFIKKHETLYNSDIFSNISVFDNSYSNEEIEQLTSISTINRFCYVKPVQARILIDTVIIMQSHDMNIELTEKYNTESSKECARAFETKKNIPQEVLNVMSSTSFLNDFSYVELDQDVDLTKFRKIEKEWTKVKAALNIDMLLTSNPQLRFRKLGKHRALGLYYPSMQCVCVDINSPSSFVHEMGHHLDYTNSDGQLSLQAEFFPLATEYKKLYNSYISCNNETEAARYLKKKVDYYFTPTEIFARTLEIYLAHKEFSTSFLKDKEKLVIDMGYPEVTKYFLDTINNYFDNIINLDLNKLVEKDVYENKISNAKIEEIIFTSTEQLGFCI